MTTGDITIERRFCGPPQSGNGGYVSGLLACYIDGPATVRLRVPPPLDVPLRVEADGTSARLWLDSLLVAEARCAEVQVDVPRSPGFAGAQLAAQHSTNQLRNVFPHCFVCGNQRPPGEGMRLFSGLVENTDAKDNGKQSVAADCIMAAPWIIDSPWADATGQLLTEYVWSALDCPGAFAVIEQGLPNGKTLLLGEMQARIDRHVALGERCVVLSWAMHSEGRKRYAGTALIGESGDIAAVARQTWFELPASSIPGFTGRA